MQYSNFWRDIISAMISTFGLYLNQKYQKQKYNESFMRGGKKFYSLVNNDIYFIIKVTDNV